MGQTKHAPGTFCWAELATTDAAGAKGFYTSLMGWSGHDDPLPSGGVYTMLQQGEGNIGALFQQMPEMVAAGIPSHWMPYVTVEDAAASAAKAKELGGTVIKDAFDVFDIGSMAVLKDPAGADFTDGRPGTVCWNELATTDKNKAGAFYAGMLGWKSARWRARCRTRCSWSTRLMPPACWR